MGGKALSNLLDLINLKLYLKHELDEFKGSFEQDELKRTNLIVFVLYVFEM